MNLNVLPFENSFEYIEDRKDMILDTLYLVIKLRKNLD